MWYNSKTSLNEICKKYYKIKQLVNIKLKNRNIYIIFKYENKLIKQISMQVNFMIILKIMNVMVRLD